MKTKKKQVLNRLNMTEDEIVKRFEDGLFSSDEQFADMIKGHESELREMSREIGTPGQVIAQTKETCNEEKNQKTTV